MRAKSLWEALLAGLREDGRVALATVVETKGSVPRHAGAKMVVLADGSTIGTVGGGSVEFKVTAAALEAMREGTARLLHLRLEEEDGSVCGGQLSVFVDPVTENPLVVMVGAGHVGAAVAAVASAAGFRVLLLDDRHDVVLAAARRTGVRGIVGPVEHLLDALRLGSSHCIVIATRGHVHDQEALRAVVTRNVAYVGMIGSKPKVRHVMANLRAEGITKEVLDRVRTPVGLDIGAETPGEIAVAIVAEMVMRLRGGSGLALKEVKGRKDSAGAGGQGGKGAGKANRKMHSAKWKRPQAKGGAGGQRGKGEGPGC